MVSGKQKHQLVDLLRWHESHDVKPVDLLLFSGGGNDVVGHNDFERFLRPYKSGYTARKCVNIDRLNRKAQQIGLAYEELADIRDHYSRTTVIMTHTYDYPYPSNQGGVFLGGLIQTKAWMKRFMDQEDIKIPPRLQADVVRIFMETLAKQIIKVGQNRQNFVVVDTLETLRGKKMWLNEIHPTSKGFEQIGEKIYTEMKNRFQILNQ